MIIFITASVLEKDSSHLLGEVAQGILPLNLVEVEGKQGLLEVAEEWEKEDEGDEEIKEVRGNAHFMHGWDETNTRTSWAMRCVQGMSVTTQDYED